MIVKEGQLFKLPTWAKGTASEMEKTFQLRYFVLKSENNHAVLYYYKDQKTFAAGGKELGHVEISAEEVLFERYNKLDFILRNEKKRFWLRAFSEVLANSWQDAFYQLGVYEVEEN
jgi:hypothetical protein